MKWDDYKGRNAPFHAGRLILTDIDCPKCGAKLYQNINRFHLTDPPKNKFECISTTCDFTGVK